MSVPEILEEDALNGQVCFWIMDNLFVDQKVSPADEGTLWQTTVSKTPFVNTLYDGNPSTNTAQLVTYIKSQSFLRPKT